MVVVVVSHISGQRRTWCLSDRPYTGGEVLDALRQREGHASNVVLQCQGRVLCPSTQIDGSAVVVATLRLPGGKGGFGSMLRAIGAQIEKTTNREACRDLSGRRLRDINEEKRLKDFIAKKADRERELQEKKRQKFKMLQESPRHTFQDEAYFQQRELREKNLYDSLDKAFTSKDGSGPSSTKRSIEEEPVTKTKKGKFLDDLEDSSSEEENSSDEAEARLQEPTDNSTSDSNSNSSSGSNIIQKAAPVKVKDNDSSSTNKGTKEGPMTRIKKGRFMDDLDESSSEDEEENNEAEGKPQESSDNSSPSKSNSIDK
ncbi:hypothetical protein O3P69_020491 [Scylla paramamosain]|uniref:SDE2-like domain-containing protein n=2 Tax=Scylla TaxID=6760 RepID=A0AAW0TLZ2_SCYPA